MFLCRAINLSPDPQSSKILQAITIVFYFCCLVAFAWNFIDPDVALKVFTLGAILSIVISISNFKHILTNKRLFILPLAILAFGLLQLIWVQIFKQPDSPFIGAYRSYQNAGKTMVLAGFVIAAININPPSNPRIFKIVNSFIILLALLLYGWICYRYYAFDDINVIRRRVSLGNQPATGTAYALTLMAILTCQALFNLCKKTTLIFYFIHFALSCFVITLTQTRAAILLYPLLNIGLFLLHYRHNRLVLLRSTIAFLILGLAALLPLKSVLEKRYIDFQADMLAYSNDNSKTSIGARFAMQHAGLIAGTTAPLFGQSLEQRSTTVHAAAKTDPSLRGALQYLNVHLHNELIDTFSLKGAFGVLLLLSCYIAAGYTALIKRNLVLFIITVTIVIYSLSDLLLYAKHGALNCILALCIALIMMPRTPRNSAYEQES